MKKPLFIAICLLLFSCLSISLFAQSLTSGLVSVWEFNETVGTSVADSYGSNNGTVNGATINQVGKIGQCIQFNGTSSYVSIPHSASLNPNSQDFSVNAWVKWEGSALSGAIAVVMAKGEYASTGSEFQFTLRGGGGVDYKNGFCFRLRTSDGTLNTIGCTTDQTSIVGNGSWHMLTAVVDEGASVEGRIFLDGTEVGSLASITALVNNTSDLHFGEYANTVYFPGKIDQPAVWNRALTTSEIQTLYNSGNGLVYSQSASTLSGGTISIGTTTVNSGSSPGSFTSLASASGGTGSYSYQWQQSADNSTWTNISGQTAATYTVPALTTSTYFRRMVTSGSYTAYSNTVVITVNTAILSGGTISIGTTTVNSGNSPGSFTSSSAASGGTGSYSYQWQQSSDNSTWTTISGQTAATYTVPALTASTYYRRMVTSGSYTAYSNTVTITVTATLNGGTISIGTTSVSSGSSPGSFTSSAAASGGTGSYSYQWQQSADNSAWSNIGGQTAATYTVPALTTTTYYRRIVISGSYTAYSNTVVITVTSSSGSVTSVNSMTGAVTLGLSASASGTQRTIAITGGTGVTIDVADNDNSSTNEIQSLSVSGSTLSISGGNSVTLPTATYPAAGIALSTGSGWGTSVTNNSANWNLAYSWGNHAGLYRPISYVPAWSEITSKPTTVSGYGITNAMTTSHAANSITSTNIAAWNAKQGALTITTNGTSGAATLSGNTLNIPQYSGGSGGSSQWTTSGSNIYYTAGAVSIGTTSFPAGYKLAVAGKIITDEVMVKTATSWPDYVFGADYRLRPLSETETFIQKNGHLPEVPNASEVKENGVGLSEMDQILLKKVEEMTLYIIQLEKRVKDLEKNGGQLSNKQ